ncbi:MAG: hypothetical protein ACMZ63_07405 [Methylotenera sp.]|jgi:hypothetical protein
MRGIKVVGKTTVPGNEQYKVVYNQYQDTVVLELGGTSLKLNAVNFMLMNEMVRKAAARLVMQTETNIK